MLEMLKSDHNMIHEVINPEQVMQADIAVFIPSYKEAANIALPTRKAATGLINFYPNLRSVIVNCDNHSEDGTLEAFFGAECVVPRLYVSSPPEARGKGINLENIFLIAKFLSAKVVIILDANLLSVKTTWIPNLAEPILSGQADYVSPLYVRHRHDSPITRVMVYPLGRALYGRQIAQPLCVDHAFSAKVNDLFLAQRWEPDDRGYKSDFQMLTLALRNQVRICQSFMAYPRLATETKLDADLAKAFTHVAKAMFKQITETRDFWSAPIRVRGTMVAGTSQPPLKPAPQVVVDRAYLRDSFLELGRQYREMWRSFLPSDLAADLDGRLAAAGDNPDWSQDQWRRSVVAAITAFAQADDGRRGDLAAALGPLFCARYLTLNLESENLTERQYNALLEDGAKNFEAAKRELLESWPN